ncbi:Olfactory Receptor 2M4 [Manis pentadactyla]|nr:Olfactory Receptor 2M4 [Manis pentadactyla]
MLEFLLMGFSDVWELRALHTISFSLIYLVMLMGDILIVTVTTLDRSLHTPMYFFLRNLSILDACYTSVTVPNSCINALLGSRTISKAGCVAQVFLVVFFVYVELLLLTIMAHDHYVAICQPLHYPVIMSHQVCVQMTLASILSGLAYAGVHTVGIPIMAWENQTFNSNFILLGIFDYSPTHIFLFLLVLGIFSVAFMGNTAMILLINLDTHLHTPMYFLLSQLSLTDLMLICTTVPKMAFNYLSGRKSISLAGCGAQIFLYVSLLGAKCFLLAAMAYDHYVAIYRPLQYSTLMSQKIYGLMTIFSKIVGSLDVGIPIMTWENQTFNSNFILLGTFDYSPNHIFLFSLVLGIFSEAFMGNTAMILLIYLDTHLHTPMYFLLSQLSLMDLMLICTTVPKMTFNYLSCRKSISLAGCGAQIFFYVSLLGAECSLLASIAYDCYVAICHPLRSSAPKSQKIRGLMAASSWILVSLDAVITASSARVLLAVIRMGSGESRRKAFAPCSSHLVVVGMYYGAAMFIYLRPASDRSPTQDKTVSAFYKVLTTKLNPLSLHSKEVASVRKVLGRGTSGE